VGKGLFEVKVESKQLPVTDEGNANLLLSLYTPKTEEISFLDTKKSYYQIKTRQGWVSNKTFRRQTIRAFTEGSVMVTMKNEKIEGRLQEVLPISFCGHPIYRYMRAFSIPIKM
jgi:CRISPR type III-A-associated RAMP protein Csm4